MSTKSNEFKNCNYKTWLTSRKKCISFEKEITGWKIKKSYDDQKHKHKRWLTYIELKVYNKPNLNNNKKIKIYIN